MAVVPNPKYQDTVIHDCIPQSGKCWMECNQCFFNRPGAYYTETPSIPTVEEVGDGIVRMNGGHDSNLEKDLVIKTAKQYKDVFFNTSIPSFDFPGPVVFTANRKEEERPVMPGDNAGYNGGIWREGYWARPEFKNLMFIRLRVSATNLGWIKNAVKEWTGCLGNVPVVLTFMAYYDHEPTITPDIPINPCYEWRVRHLNSYWCPTKEFMRCVMDIFKDNRLVSLCGSIQDGPWCKGCRNCETYYLQAKKRLKGE